MQVQQKRHVLQPAETRRRQKGNRVPCLGAWYISTTASTSLRTLIVPDVSPPLVHDHENWRPASSRPSRCQRRTSIDL